MSQWAKNDLKKLNFPFNTSILQYFYGLLLHFVLNSFRNTTLTEVVLNHILRSRVFIAVFVFAIYSFTAYSKKLSSLSSGHL